MVTIKALACELPHELGIPLSRFSMADLKRAAIDRGIVASIGETTIWRWLSEEANKPWNHRSWIFPRDPDFTAKGGSILDLYEGFWEGKPLGADEKTGIQARRRRHGTYPPGAGMTSRGEHEYIRMGALAYLAAWDVRLARVRVFGRCEAKSGIASFDRLVLQVMSREPYQSASRVFWIVDNESSHPGQANIHRLQSRWPNLVLVHTPVHASWLNQVEICVFRTGRGSHRCHGHPPVARPPAELPSRAALPPPKCWLPTASRPTTSLPSRRPEPRQVLHPHLSPLPSRRHFGLESPRRGTP